MSKWNRHFHQPSLPLGEDGRLITASKKHIELSRNAAQEGMVLLKNDDGILPLKIGTKVAIFGKASVEYVRGGGGSGEVTVSYSRSLYEGLKIKESENKICLYDKLADYYQSELKKQYEEGYEIGMTEEIDIPKDFLEEASSFTDTAIITLCRFSGEGWDRKPSLEKNDALWESELNLAKRQAKVFPDSDFKLTEKEKLMINSVKSKFKNVIITINSGGVIETAWIKNDKNINAALYMWQGGIEGGLAAADILVGDVTPSGKLVDTFADSLDDYPSTYNFHDSIDYVEYTDDIYVGYRYFNTIPNADKKIIYPFGYGLSYTEFKYEILKVNKEKDSINIDIKVTNIGSYEGKDVLMLYYCPPSGRILRPKYELCDFVKTKNLIPNESQNVTLKVEYHNMATFDDTGVISNSSWVLEKGDYKFFIGNDITDLTMIDDTYSIEEDRIIKKLSSKLAPSKLKCRMKNDGTFEDVVCSEPRVKESCIQRMNNKDSEGNAPYEREQKIHHLWGNKNTTLFDVYNNKCTLDDFMSQLTDDDLIHLLGGQSNTGVANTFGVGNMPEYGIPNVMTADGPAGLRILPDIGVYTTAWPCATQLACSFNVELAKEIGCAVAKEVKENNIGIWLAPAVNIHRTPMCGRNFEYYSEDPLVAGRIGASVVSGVQSQNIAATVKHFALNNKETNRKNSDSRVSERAAREIYLKPFEIIVNSEEPWCIMTSYNIINGVQSSENDELINGILRDEWGYKGLVMSDWWTSGEHYLEIKAGNDLKMANGYPERVKYALDLGAISHEELYKAAKNVLQLILKME